jgi:hypothetical protein
MTKPHCILFIIALLLISCKGPQTITSTQPSSITTLLLDGEAGGCGFFVVYKSTQDKTKTVIVSGESGKIKVSKTPETYDIENTQGVEVRLVNYGEKGYLEPPCNASVPSRPVLQQIKAASGKVTIFITREKIKGSRQVRAYAITVVLENVTFPASDGRSYYIERAEMEDVVAGTQSA